MSAARAFAGFCPIYAAPRRSCEAAFVRFSVIEASCRPRWWLDVADGCDDLPKQRATHGDLCQLERDLTRVAYNTRPDLDETALDACERPIRNLFREVYTLQEDTEIVSQCVKQGGVVSLVEI